MEHIFFKIGNIGTYNDGSVSAQSNQRAYVLEK